MAKRYQNRKRRSKYTELEKLAYKFGKISAGLCSDTKVLDSFNNGANSKNKPVRIKKPLY